MTTDHWITGIAAITVFTEDLPATKAFYRDVFGLAVHFETPDSAVFRFGSTLLNLLDIANAPELVDPAPVARPDAGARAVYTLGVDDVDAQCAELPSAPNSSAAA